MQLPLHSTSDRSDLRRLQRTFSRGNVDADDVNLRVLLPYRIEWELARLDGPTAGPQFSTEIGDMYRGSMARSGESDADLLQALLQTRTRRSGEARPPLAFSHSPLAPAAIEIALARFFEWLTSPAWNDMHPLERLVLGQVRLLEIWPLSQRCEAVVSVWLGCIAMRSGLLLPAPSPGWSDYFRGALDQAFQMDTRLLHTFHLESCIRAYELVQESL